MRQSERHRNASGEHGVRRLGLSTYFIIFGAAVREDGSPSGSLRRRAEGALALARDVSPRTFLATGGVGDHPPAEAIVIRDLLAEGGVDPKEVILDCEATDTYSSILNCSAILRERGDAERIFVCSSGYHNPRCAWLLRLMGHRATWGPMPADRAMLGTGKWLYYLLREAIATPWDSLLVIIARLRGR